MTAIKWLFFNFFIKKTKNVKYSPKKYAFFKKNIW